MRLAKVTDTLRGLARYVVLAASTALVACGGPGGTAPTTTPSPTIAVALSAATVTAATPVTVTARLLGGDNKPIVGAKVTFSTDAAVGVISPGELVTSGTGTSGSGQLISGSAVTSAEGLASVQLRAGPSAGVGTVTVTYDVPATSGSGTTASAGQTLSAQVNYTSTGGGVRPSSVVITSPVSTVDVNTPAVLSAQVFGADGRPVSNVVVTFSVDANLGSLSPGRLSTDGLTSTGTAISNAAGIATIQLNAGPESGAGTVTATSTPPAAGGTTSVALVGSLSFTSRGGGTKPSTRLQLQISSSTVSANAPATISARLIRADGGSVASQKITFDTDGNFGLVVPGTVGANGRSQGSALTDINGVATVQLSAGPRVGAETVTVTFIPTTASASQSLIQEAINYTSQGGGSAPATNIQLSMSSSTLSANAPVVVTARLTRSDGGSISGQRIQFLTDANFGVFSPGSVDSTGQSSGGAITDASGVATIQILAGPRSGVGTISANFVPLNATGGASAGVSQGINYTSAGGGSRASTLTLSIVPATLSANVPSIITARLIGADNRPVVGGVVTFSTDATRGVFEPASGVALTNAEGVASIGIKAGIQTGPGTVTASYTPETGTAITATLAYGSSGGGGATTTTLLLSIDNNNLTATGTSTITATLTNANGQPVPNTRITFTTDNNFGVLVPGSGTALTNAGGVATIQIRAGARQGAGAVAAVSDALVDGTVGRATIGYISGGGGGPIDVGVPAASLQLLVSSGTLVADGASTVTLTALVKDANNNTLQGKAVSFSSNAGAITVDSASGGVTGPNGQLSATLSTLGDKSTRTITVTATLGSLVATNTVQVTGSKVNVAGVSSLVIGATTQITIRVQDGGDKPVPSQTVTLRSALNNQFANAAGTPVTSVITDSSGQATVTYRALNAGNDVISASALNETGVLNLAVSNQQFTVEISRAPGLAFQSCSSSTPLEVALNTAATVRVTYLVGGVAQAGSVNFSSTRGTVGATTATLVSGQTSTTVQAATAGGGVITATSGNVSAQCAVEFVATSPFRLVLQAGAAVLAPNGKTTITATVRDAADNLVKNQTVVFTLVDSTGGTLSVAQGVTDSFGQTSTTYTAGNSSSAKDAVQISALIPGATTLTINNSPLRLTVAGQSLFVKVGTGNTVGQLNATVNQLPYSVIVTDAAGNAVNGAQVTLTLQSLTYRKGFFIYNGTTWVAVGSVTNYTVAAGAACNAGDITVTASTATTEGSCRAISSPIVCDSEDVNNNGLLDLGEDLNGSTQLEPGFVAAVPQTATTDATGTAQIQINYPKDRAVWVGVRLIARATVQGTEGTGTADFNLGGVASDYTNQAVSPPGQPSPYGTVQSCTNPS